MSLNDHFFDRKIVISIILSILFHSAIFYSEGRMRKARILMRIDNVEFIDETASLTPVSSPPTRSIFEAIKEKFRGMESTVEEPDIDEVARIVHSLPPVPGVNHGKGIELDKIHLDRTQAKGIDLDKFERIEGPEGGITEIIRVASEEEQRESGDILSKAPIKIDRKKLPPPEARVGLFSSPGGGIDLEKMPTEEIKRSSPKIPEEDRAEAQLKTIPSERKTEITITGSLSEREIKYKPLPLYPEWAAREGLTAIISVRIMCNPDGTVQEGVFVLRTSGYGSWDRTIINAIKKWRFAPLSPDEPQVVQSGIINIKFILE